MDQQVNRYGHDHIFKFNSFDNEFENKDVRWWQHMMAGGAHAAETSAGAEAGGGKNNV